MHVRWDLRDTSMTFFLKRPQGGIHPDIHGEKLFGLPHHVRQNRTLTWPFFLSDTCWWQLWCVHTSCHPFARHPGCRLWSPVNMQRFRKWWWNAEELGSCHETHMLIMNDARLKSIERALGASRHQRTECWQTEKSHWNVKYVAGNVLLQKMYTAPTGFWKVVGDDTVVHDAFGQEISPGDFLGLNSCYFLVQTVRIHNLEESCRSANFRRIRGTLNDMPISSLYIQLTCMVEEYTPRWCWKGCGLRWECCARRTWWDTMPNSCIPTKSLVCACMMNTLVAHRNVR